MIKRLSSGKLSFVWIALSSAIILAGIILFALFGFNNSADMPNSYSFEVKYDSVVTAEQKVGHLENVCNDAFNANGLSFEKKTVAEVDGFHRVIAYAFDGDTSKEALAAAKSAIEAKVQTDLPHAMIYVSVNSVQEQAFTTAQWRGAVAIAVGAVVALGYIAIRFGLGSALCGLISAVHDAFFVLELLVICRIPVYGFMPLTLGALAAFLSLFNTLLTASKTRENTKSPEYAGASAEDVVYASVTSSAKAVLAVAIVLTVFFVLMGTLATAGGRAFFLPALLVIAGCTYSSLVLMPAITAQIKAKFMRAALKRKRYVRTAAKETAKETAAEVSVSEEN